MASRLEIWPSYLFPSVLDVLRTLADGISDKSFLIGTAISLKRILIGYALSLVMGILLGTAMGRVKALRESFGGLILGLQTLPSICWLPLALLWFGLSEAAILFVVVMGAVLSITIATQDGIRSVPPILIRAGENMGAKGFRLLVEVILPAALPSIMTGMKQGWSFAWRSLMAGELLYVSVGLGHLLTVGRELNDMSQVIAVMIVIVLIGLAVDRLVFAQIEGKVREQWGLG
ncbi:MAG: ABC transporter permease [Acidobacteriota bacterium]